jgi:hypothetical protein
VANQHLNAIRTVDFRNHVYPIIELGPDATPAFRKLTLEEGGGLVRLINGMATVERSDSDLLHYRLRTIELADVTGDGQEEAIVVLNVKSSGTQSWGYLYVYSSVEGKLVLLGTFLTGDRADGGLHRVFELQSNLMIQVYTTENAHGDCCPTEARTYMYRWNGATFVQVGRAQRIALPDRREK